MKKLIIILLFIIPFVACNKNDNCEDERPQPPYGKPDDTSEFSDGSGYETIEYIYYCYNGNYTIVTYTRERYCGGWVPTYYKSTCLK